MKSCSCSVCQSACQRKPGWFMPEQIEPVLKYFKVGKIGDILGEGKLAIDWWAAEEDILILAPNIKGNNSISYPANPKGECVFYREGKCGIYEIRPYECREFYHDPKEVRDARHWRVREAWEGSKLLKKFRDKMECSSWSLCDELKSEHLV